MIENSGVWSLMGERMMMVHQDLILRFESYFLPYLDNIHEGRKNSCLWGDLDNKKSDMWTIFSDTMREIFFNQGHHVIISKEQDWIAVAQRHLGKNGLGSIDSINSIDDFGGIEILTTSCFHPAIYCEDIHRYEIRQQMSEYIPMQNIHSISHLVPAPCSNLLIVVLDLRLE